MATASENIRALTASAFTTPEKFNAFCHNDGKPLGGVIGGQWIPGSMNATFETVDPGSQEVLARICEMGEAEVANAVDAAERAFIEAELDAPVDAMALANDTSQQMAAQVYAAALMTVKVDNLDEAQYLNTLANGLNLTDDTRKRVHNAMGLG